MCAARTPVVESGREPIGMRTPFSVALRDSAEDDDFLALCYRATPLNCAEPVSDSEDDAGASVNSSDFVDPYTDNESGAEECTGQGGGPAFATTRESVMLSRFSTESISVPLQGTRMPRSILRSSGQICSKGVTLPRRKRRDPASRRLRASCKAARTEVFEYEDNCPDRAG